MKFVLTDSETIPEWLYPGSWRDLETKPYDLLESSVVAQDDFSKLWEILDPKADAGPLFLGEEVEDVGIPHSAPSHVDRFNPAFLNALLAFPPQERWILARDWATALAGRPPNKERLQSFKKFLKVFCAFAARSDDAKMLVILPEGFDSALRPSFGSP